MISLKGKCSLFDSFFIVNGRILGNVLDKGQEVRLITAVAAPGRRSALDFFKEK